MTTLQGFAFKHEDVPEQKYPWGPIKSISSQYHPYFVTFDPMGAASHVWSVESGKPVHVTSLSPPLPGEILDRRAMIAYSSNLSVLVVGFDLVPSFRPDKPDKPVMLRAYGMDTGELLHEIELPGRLGTFCWSSEFIAVATERPFTQLVVYKLEVSRFQEVHRISPQSGNTLVPVFLQDSHDDFMMITASTASHPASDLCLTMHTRRGEKSNTTLSRPQDLVDWVRPRCVAKISESAIVLCTEESHSSNDHHPDLETSTACVVEMPDLSVSWRRHFNFTIVKVSAHLSLGAVVVLGSKTQKLNGDDASISFIAFLNIRDGSVMREETFRSQPGILLTRHCTSSDELVITTVTGRICIVPLCVIIDEGFQSKDEEELVITQKLPVQPEPYNTKTSRAAKAERWQWVDHNIVYSKGVVLFPLRVPDVYGVSW